MRTRSADALRAASMSVGGVELLDALSDDDDRDDDEGAGVIRGRFAGRRWSSSMERVDRRHVTFSASSFPFAMSRLLGPPLRLRLRLTRGTASSTAESPFSAHLDAVFAPLQFPPELAKRILTHGSHKEATHGHNGRLSFVGMCFDDALASCL